MMTGACRSAPRALVTSDASDWGCGAFSSQGLWFQLRWPPSWGGGSHHLQGARPGGNVSGSLGPHVDGQHSSMPV